MDRFDVLGCLPPPLPDYHSPDAPRNLRGMVRDLLRSNWWETLVFAAVLVSSVLLALQVCRRSASRSGAQVCRRSASAASSEHNPIPHGAPPRVSRVRWLRLVAVGCLVWMSTRAGCVAGACRTTPGSILFLQRGAAPDRLGPVQAGT